MAASGSGKILFYGESAEEAEDFIFAIKDRAYAEGKQKDNAWIADFASICFAKKALRWYEELNEETQSDWKLLRQAILAKYNHVQSSSTVPSTTASVSHRSEAIVLPTLVPAAPPPNVSNIKKGYIRVESPPQARGYIGNALINNEWCTTVPTRSEAAVFEFLATPKTIRFQGDGEVLAIQSHYKNLNLATGSRTYCAVFKGSKAKDSTVYQWSGPRLHNLWSIIDDDQLVADWPTDEGSNYRLNLQALNLLTESVEGQWTLQPVIYSVDRRLYMAIDAATFAKGSEEEFYQLAVLRWEII